MKRLDRRTFTLLVSVGGTGAILTACGNDPDDVDLNPTIIPVDGAPPTLAPNASPASETVEEPEAEAGGGEGGGTVATVTATDLSFDPKELTVAADTDVTITLVNEGVLEHDLAIEDTDYITELIGGDESVDLVVNLPAGDYIYYCSVAGHREAGMEGTLHVVEGGGEEAPAEEEAPAGEEAAAGDGGAATSGEVTATDLLFDPKELTVAADTDVTLTLVNNGVLEHDLAIEDTDFATELIGGGETADLVVNLPAGDYIYYCTVAGHREAGMEGTLHVVAGGGGEAAAGEEAAGEVGGEASPAASGDLEPVTVEAIDPFQWSIGELSVAPGQVIHVVNTGLLEHDFVVDELGIEAPLPIGETVDVTVPEDAPVGDTYEFYCSIPGHRESGMKGTITIVESPAGPDAQGGPSEDVAPPTQEVGSDVQELMEDPAVVALEATDPYNWSWKAIDAYPGQIIRVINLGVLEHDFVIDELDIKQILPFGEPIDIQVPATVEPGETYLYYCSIPGHRELGMEGTLTIIEEGATASPVAAEGATPQVTGEATPAASPVAESGGGDAATDVAVSAIELAFDPKELTIAANTDVTLTLTNNGVLEHDLVIEELGIGTDLLPSSESQTITVNAAPGTYEFHCTVPGHADAGMTGTLTVV